MEYPEEIYATRDSGLLTGKQLKYAGSGWGRRLAFDVGYDVGYVAGRNEQSDYIESMSSLESVLTDVEQLEGEDLPFVKRLIERTVRAVRAEQADPLAGYSNLTAAISAGEPIDWERLDGLKVQCVKPEVGTLHGTLERNESRTADYHAGWWSKDADSLYRPAFIYGWTGYDGWTLWVEGEIPMRSKTADQLKLGTYFLGKTPSSEAESWVYVGGWNIRDLKSIYHAPTMIKSPVPAEKWVVIEEHGTFQKPEGK